MFDKNATGADIALSVGRAYRAAKDRNHIFEKMENHTFKDSDMDNVKIITSDLDKEISKLKTKKETRTPIGFKKTTCEK